MDKLEYVARSLSRGTNKKYETYVIYNVILFLTLHRLCNYMWKTAREYLAVFLHFLAYL